MKYSTKLFIFFISLALNNLEAINYNFKKIPVYSFKQPIQNLTDSIQESETPVITVWIHGTRTALASIAQKETAKPVPAGFNNALSPEIKEHFVSQIAKNLFESNSDQFKLEHIFFYGWSGKLSATARQQEAGILHKHLVNFINDYQKKYNLKPRIRIIAHSHGGNMALNLAHYNKDNEIIIDELILLGCPIQKTTNELVESSMFKKVYSLFSYSDWIQPLDIGAKRYFEQNCKVIQARVQFSEGWLGHQEFFRDAFIKSLIHILINMNSLEYDAKIIPQFIVSV